ncbi:MAG TPA: hypothetical protein VN688_26860 [Gemmataceae bacterium]|nr:hypothetical protein [Gemmataceae bacterium]
MAPPIRVGLLAICWTVVAGLPLAAGESVDDEQILKTAGFATEDRALLDFFRKQTITPTTKQQTQTLIGQLGADSFQVREKASGALAALGPVVLPLLRQTMRETTDFEVRRRARACVQQIQVDCPPSVIAAAARLLALRKPAGAAETLLLFLPAPYQDEVHEEIQAALDAVARINNRIDPVFVASLTDALAARRTVAAVTLCRTGAIEHRLAVRKLLRDKETSVRCTIAQELAMAGDKEAVPVLIDLLAQLPLEQAGSVEELLYRLAGVKAPPIPLSSEPVAQCQCRDAWREWWRAYGDRVEMAVLKDRERMLGYTLLVLLNDNRVVEWDRDGKSRWQINGLASPLDAEVLPGQRVLIAEYDTKRVTERNLKGEVLWEKKLPEPPIHVQRLRNGFTFIATRKQLIEVDRSGKREFVRYRSTNGIITARRFRDGRIGCIENGSYFELAPTGEERRRFAVNTGVFTTNALTLLPNGHLLIAAYGGGIVQEYDRAGKVVWQIKIGRPLCAQRLPGGNTLVSSQEMVLIEYDRAGKQVARHEAPGHPCQVRRR